MADGDVDGWSAMIDVNLRGVLYGIAAADAGVPAPGPRSFRDDGVDGRPEDRAGHGGLRGDEERGPHRDGVLRQESTDGVIRTTSISPGFVRTELGELDRRPGHARPDTHQHG